MAQPLLSAAGKARIVHDRRKPGLLALVGEDGKAIRQVIYQSSSPASELRARKHLASEARALGYLLTRAAR